MEHPLQKRPFWMLVLSITVSADLNAFSRYVGDLDDIRFIDTKLSLKFLGEFSRLFNRSRWIRGITFLPPRGGSFLLGSWFSLRLREFIFKVYFELLEDWIDDIWRWILKIWEISSLVGLLITVKLPTN
jgi:hypothetical protein